MNNENQNIPYTQPTNNAQFPQENGTKKHGMGPVIGALIIVVLLVLAAMYFWGKSDISNNTNQEQTDNNTLIPANRTTDPVVQNDPESAAMDAELNGQLNDIDSLTF
jgi:hypothetical protein